VKPFVSVLFLIAIINYMDTPHKLTNWQKRHKELLEQALLNPDLCRDNSPLYNSGESQDSSDAGLHKLMSKYGIQIECFEVLKKSCTVGGDLDYKLITPERRLPKVLTYAKRDQAAYNMRVQQGKSVKEITEYLRTIGYDVDIQYVSKIIKRMNAKDPNSSRNYRPRNKHENSGQ
jgi:hypothetical protein